MSTIVHVTDEDIKPGDHRPDTCPVALGTKRATGLKAWIQVGRHSIYIGLQEIRLPDEAVEWIRRYDSGHPMAPISFPLDI